ncbi:Cell morphogenesis protein PAG1 [Dimargaris xerosporica]|nr:Cell morphogenesis protein PAG1 [Dimargaris xerosporica]
MNHSSLRLAHPGAFHFSQQPDQRNKELEALSSSLASSGSTINPNLLNVPSFNPHGVHNPSAQEQSSPDFSMQQDMDMSDQLHAMASPITIAKPGGGVARNLADSDSAEDRHNSLNPSSPFAASPANNGLLYSPLGDSTIYENSEFTPGSYHAPTGSIPINISQNMPNRFFQPDQMATSPPVQAFQSMSLPSHPPEWLSSSFDISGFANATSPNQFTFPPNDPALMNAVFDPKDPEMVERIAIMNEKRRRRRESHNAVERRRRDNINEKIQELCALLPNNFSEGPAKPNKGSILRQSVDYIRQLQQLIQQQNQRIQELERNQ